MLLICSCFSYVLINSYPCWLIPLFYFHCIFYEHAIFNIRFEFVIWDSCKHHVLYAKKIQVIFSFFFQILASMADSSGQISAVAMERLTAASAAEPYESVSCAFVSYGSCAMDLAEGWKYRSRLWYGVGLPSKPSSLGGGGSGSDSWKSTLEKDAHGNWIELPLVKKSVSMLQALLLDESGLGGGLGIGGGSGTGMGGMTALYQLLDSDQPFLCMLRMVLLSMREEDYGEDNMLMRNLSSERSSGNSVTLDSGSQMSMRQSRSALLWR